ncbi:uroporphyrinogen-III synthase [Galactobacter valiniphilus]|uniref:Uroporphyrinogen-III synthase n=1 Tax=Galactobacter valiniphilus TaxID=2676122 RepID=A0A399JAK1_9MICC|nr:uroporphyrinogen-III synthase [Galactobacter valiniphilus]RII42601.1 uroporphyrinogen-III synthase [Galactobacter valiniphilus]
MSTAMGGPRVAVLRSEDRAAPLAHALVEAGAVPVLCPLIANELPADPEQRVFLAEQLAALAEGHFAWVAFTSVSTVRALVAIAGEAGEGQDTALKVSAVTKVAAVGKATARALEAAGVTVDLLPHAEHSARGLLAEWPVPEDTAFAAVLLPAADLAAPTLRDGLLERGWRPVDLMAYRTVDAPGDPELLLSVPVPGQPAVAAPSGLERLSPAELAAALAAGTLDAAILTSPSTARRVAVLLDGRESATGFIAIGPRTAKEALAHGLRVDAVAKTTDPAGLAGALAAREAAERKQP